MIGSCPSICQMNESGKLVEMGSTVAVKVYGVFTQPTTGPLRVTAVGGTSGSSGKSWMVCVPEYTEVRTSALGI